MTDHARLLSQPPWRFVLTPPAEAAWNLGVDEAIMQACQRRLAPPTIRVFAWRPAAVSLGYGQDIVRELDLVRCRSYRIDVVRRHTGCRTVLHDEEAAYSLIAPEGHPALEAGAHAGYRTAGKALVYALHRLGIPASLIRTPAGDDGMLGACFTSCARYEVAVLGKKIAGSAQRRAGGVVLQHGTLLLGPAHRRLPLLLPPARGAERTKMMTALIEGTTSVSELTGRHVPFEEMAALIRRGFEVALGQPLEDGGLTEQELYEAERLVRRKYGTETWTAARRTGDG